MDKGHGAEGKGQKARRKQRRTRGTGRKARGTRQRGSDKGQRKRQRTEGNGERARDNGQGDRVHGGKKWDVGAVRLWRCTVEAVVVGESGEGGKGGEEQVGVEVGGFGGWRRWVSEGHKTGILPSPPSRLTSSNGKDLSVSAASRKAFTHAIA